MAERLSELEARVESVRQLSSVISAMRGIAAAHSHEANARLPGIRAYAETIAKAIAQTLAFLPGHEGHTNAAEPAAGRIVIAICTEQGFVGAFNAHVLDAVERIMGGREAALLVLGDRGAALASERDLRVDWSAAMAAHVDQLTDLANQLADTLFERLQTGTVHEVTVVHARPSREAQVPQIVEQRLLPFDYARFPASPAAQPPLLHLAPLALLTRLADEYVFAELCGALTLSYAAESEARMQAMVAARENVAQKLEELSARARLLRQEQITDEVIELAAGASARQE